MTFRLHTCAVLLALAFSPSQGWGRSFRAGQEFRDSAAAPAMIVIPAGRALLGSTEAETTREGRTPAFAQWERPRHEAVFARPFAVGKYHVTRRELAAFAKETGRALGGCVVVQGGKWSDGPVPSANWSAAGHRQGGDHPALCVNWDDANAYAAWLSRKTGARYRLLTEDEWEYAARGGRETARWWGDGTEDICRRANGGDARYAAAVPGDRTANLACSDGYAFTSPVGHYPANPFELHDMLGNAWQWTANCFSPDPATADDAVAQGECKSRSIRGGSWHNSVSTLRPATRFSLPPAMRSSSLGFRVMRELP